MRGAAVVALLVLAAPATAQRPACGYGMGLDALRRARAALTEGARAPDLTHARTAAANAEAALREAIARMAGCGCAQVEEPLRDALAITAPATIAAAVPEARNAMGRAGISADTAHGHLSGRGCR